MLKMLFFFFLEVMIANLDSSFSCISSCEIQFPLSSSSFFLKIQTPIHRQIANTRSTRNFLKFHQGVEEEEDDDDDDDDDDEIP